MTKFPRNISDYYCSTHYTHMTTIYLIVSAEFSLSSSVWLLHHHTHVYVALQDVSELREGGGRREEEEGREEGGRKVQLKL